MPGQLNAAIAEATGKNVFDDQQAYTQQRLYDQPEPPKSSGLDALLGKITSIGTTAAGLYTTGATALQQAKMADDVEQLRLQQERARQTQMVILFGVLIALTGFAIYRVIRKK